MKKKWIILSAALCLFGLISCGVEYEFDTESPDTGAKQTAEYTYGDTEQRAEVSQTGDRPLANDIDPGVLIQQNLNLHAPGIYEGYPVDEAFWSWLGGQYGMDFLQGFADEVWRYRDSRELWYHLTGKTMHVLWLDYCKTYDYATYWKENVTYVDTAKEDAVTIDLIGDINFDENWHTMRKAAEMGGVENCISESIQKELKQADLTVVNNEFTYTTDSSPLAGKSYTFKSDPSNAGLLEIFGADLVSLANNHTFDYGEKGFLDTLDTLTEAGYSYMGAGRNLAEASAVKYFVMGGRKIAFVSATEIERSYHYTRMAGETTPGVLKTQQSDALRNALEEADAKSDYVIAYIHWGGEGKIINDEGQRRLAEAIAESGADVIIGGHPHRLQGAAFINEVPVAYSLGNFWFSTGSLYTTIARITIDSAGKLSLSFLPCIQRELTTSLLEDEEEITSFYHYFADISENIGIDENGTIYQKSQENGADYLYSSEETYGLWNNLTDLDGWQIDIVGNRVEH